ncbi:MAG: SGNH/GDSL hydrolase family protein [Planctomycetota bacterium]
MKKAFLALAFGVCLALGAGEIASRIVLNSRRNEWIEKWITNRPVTEIDIYAPNHHICYKVAPNAPSMQYRGPHNSLGFRGPEPRAESKDWIRIVCMGGSTTYGTRNANESDCWPRKLETILRASNPNIEVINAGVPAYTSAESLQSLREEILPLNPDIVIFLAGFNDVMPRFMPDFCSDYSHYRKTWQRPALEKPEPVSGLALFSIFKKDLYNNPVHLPLRLLTGKDYHEMPEAEVVAFDSNSAATFRRNVRTFTDAAQGAGANVLLVTQSFLPELISVDFIQPRIRFFETGLREHSEAVRAVAKETNAPLADLESFITDRTAFDDIVHHTALGAELMAQAIAREIVANALLEPRAKPK